MQTIYKEGGCCPPIPRSEFPAADMPEELYVTMSWWAEWAHNRADDYIIRINIAHTADKLIIFTLYEQLPRERQLDVAVLSEWGHENQLHHAIMWNMNSAQMASSVATWKPWTYHTTNTAWQLHSSMVLPEMDVLVDWRWFYFMTTVRSVALWLPRSKIGTTTYPTIGMSVSLHQYSRRSWSEQWQ